MHEMYALVSIYKTIHQNKFPIQGKRTKPKKIQRQKVTKTSAKPCKEKYKTYSGSINYTGLHFGRKEGVVGGVVENNQKVSL